jgi:hypothetical protein
MISPPSYFLPGDFGAMLLVGSEIVFFFFFGNLPKI